MDRVLCLGTHALNLAIYGMRSTEWPNANCVHLSSVRQIRCYKRIEVWLTYHGARGTCVLISECDY